MASPLSGPPQRAGGGARSHGLAQPHRSPLIRTIPPGRDSGTGTRRRPAPRPPGVEGFAERCPPSQDGALQEGAGGRSMPAPIVSFDGVTNRMSPAARYERRHRPGSLRADRQRLVRGLQPKRNRRLRTCEQQRALHGYPDLRLTQPGRPVVLYDQFSERWLASQFATGPLGMSASPSRRRVTPPALVRVRVPDPPDEVRRLPEVRRLAGPERLLHDRQPVRFRVVEPGSTASSETGCSPVSRRASSTRTCTTSTPSPDRCCRPTRTDRLARPREPPSRSSRCGTAHRTSSACGAGRSTGARAVAGRHPRPGSRTASFSSNLCGGSWNCIPQPGTRVGWSRL